MLKLKIVENLPSIFNSKALCRQLRVILRLCCDKFFKFRKKKKKKFRLRLYRVRLLKVRLLKVILLNERGVEYEIVEIN